MSKDKITTPEAPAAGPRFRAADPATEALAAELAASGWRPVCAPGAVITPQTRWIDPEKPNTIDNPTGISGKIPVTRLDPETGEEVPIQVKDARGKTVDATQPTWTPPVDPMPMAQALDVAREREFAREAKRMAAATA